MLSWQVYWSRVMCTEMIHWLCSHLVMRIKNLWLVALFHQRTLGSSSKNTKLIQNSISLPCIKSWVSEVVSLGVTCQTVLNNRWQLLTEYNPTTKEEHRCSYTFLGTHLRQRSVVLSRKQVFIVVVLLLPWSSLLINPQSGNRWVGGDLSDRRVSVIRAF